MRKYRRHGDFIEEVEIFGHCSKYLPISLAVQELSLNLLMMLREICSPSIVDPAACVTTQLRFCQYYVGYDGALSNVVALFPLN